jgi:hypothetical protein
MTKWYATKRRGDFNDLAAISIAILFIFAVVVMSVRSAAITIWQLGRGMYAASEAKANTAAPA